MATNATRFAFLKKVVLRHLELLLIPLWLAGICAQASAADEAHNDSPVADAATSPSIHGATAGRWSFDLESSYVFWDIQNPFWLVAGQRGVGNMKNPWHYHLNSYVIGGRYDLANTSGWGFLRGHLQSSVGVIGADILQGPEHYYAGVLGGLRYLFEPGASAWSPYVEFREAVGVTDASHVFYGQQDNISFMYLFGFGVRHEAGSKRRFSMGIVDQHMSDAYLTKYNYGFDSVGFIVSVEWRP